MVEEEIKSKRIESFRVPVISSGDSSDMFQPSKEEALGKIALHLAETKDNKVLTDLDSRTINLLSILLGVSEQLNIETYKNICNTYMRLRVSNKRLGRKELLEIARAVREEGEIGKMSRLRRLFGMGVV
jgi:hypothetical protein